MELFLDRSGTTYEEKRDNTDRSEEKKLRIAQLQRWIQEDRTNGDYCCARTLKLWRAELLKRLEGQNPPRLPPMRVKLPRCLATTNGLQSQEVWIFENLSVHVAIKVREHKWEKGMELLPAIN